ncbi:MAG: hypothetical protein M3R25_09105 [Bacteroidota bacterium]|nr:hypothetical protein [Bacteroidota bacterium]
MLLSNQLMRKILMVTLIICCLHVFGSAQYEIKALPRWMVGTHLNFMIPQEPLNTFLKDDRVGFMIEAQYRVQYNKPLLAGLYYGETGLSQYSFRYTTSDGIDIKERARTRRLEAGITAGFYPEINWLFQPYLQGHAGLALFQTSSILKDTDSQDIVDRIPENSSYVPAYGLDLGIHIVPNIWYLRGDVRIGFAGNTSAYYLLLDEENKDTIGFPIDYFITHSSAGKWLKVSVGLSYLF